MTHEQIEQGSIEKLGRLSPAFFVGAEWAAEEQRDIDIKKAAEWLENAINGDNIEGCKDCEKLIDDFKKAMEL